MRTPAFFATLALLGACSIEHSLQGKEEVEDEAIDTGSTTTSSSSPTEPVAGEPVADAGDDAEVRPLDTVTLDGTRSYDPDGLEIVEVEWTIVSLPAGSTASLDDITKPKPEFFADLAGEYVFELTVMNEDGQWDSTPDTVVITSLPTEGFYVELSWDADNDLDLHLMPEGSDIFGANDVNWCNDNPSWGAPGPDDDPSLDWDAIDGFGPETATIPDPPDGVYNVQVHYYGEDGFARCVGNCATATATIRIYLGGVLAAEMDQVFTDQGQVWDAATIEWPSGQITEVDGTYTTNKEGC